MEKNYEYFLLKLKELIRIYASKFIFSLGVGGLISLYVTELFRIKLLPYLNGVDEIYNVLMNLNIKGINFIEPFILIISLILIISAPLFSKNFSGKTLKLVFLILTFGLEIISCISVFIKGEISNSFILMNIIIFTYFVWLIIDILKIIYSWSRIDKLSENQVDVTKLTLIWAIIAFLLGLLK